MGGRLGWIGEFATTCVGKRGAGLAERAEIAGLSATWRYYIEVGG